MMLWKNMIAWQIMQVISIAGLVYFTRHEEEKRNKFIWIYLVGFCVGVMMQYFFPA